MHTYNVNPGNKFKRLGIANIINKASNITLHLVGHQSIRHVFNVNISQHQYFLLSVHLHHVNCASWRSCVVQTRIFVLQNYTSIIIIATSHRNAVYLSCRTDKTATQAGFSTTARTDDITLINVSARLFFG